MLFHLRADFDKCWLFSRAAPGRFGRGTDAAADLSGILQDGVAIQVVEIPARYPGFLGELAGLLFERRQRVAEEDT